MFGVGVGLLFRAYDECNEVFHGETDLQYLQRKHQEVVQKNWGDG